MNYQKLLVKSEEHFRKFPLAENRPTSFFVFTNGAKWMMQRMNELDGKHRVFDSSIAYERYGFLKYGFCLFFFLYSSIFLLSKAIILLPLAVLVFYLLEVQFLFLFPLLIDKIENPMKKSIRMVHKIGICQSLLIVMPIGFFMMFGLLFLRNPLHNWHLGCLAILIWYADEKN